MQNQGMPNYWNCPILPLYTPHILFLNSVAHVVQETLNIPWDTEHWSSKEEKDGVRRKEGKSPEEGETN